MGENPGEVILTLKKRPKHSALGQIYIKPFRIPARKKSAYYINNLPSPRTELLVVPDVSMPIKKRHPSSSSAASTNSGFYSFPSFVKAPFWIRIRIRILLKNYAKSMREKFQVYIGY
jgi:hypothetical protein